MPIYKRKATIPEHSRSFQNIPETKIILTPPNPIRKCIIQSGFQPNEPHRLLFLLLRWTHTDKSEVFQITSQHSQNGPIKSWTISICHFFLTTPVNAVLFNFTCCFGLCHLLLRCGGSFQGNRAVLSIRFTNRRESPRSRTRSTSILRSMARRSEESWWACL